MSLVVNRNYIINCIDANIINDNAQNSDQNKCTKIFRRVLYISGACLGFAAQVPYVKIAMQASDNPIFSKVLGGVYFVSFGAFFTWLYGKIIQSEVGANPGESRTSISCSKASLKTTKIGLAVILGLISMTPDAWFAYQFNESLAYPLLSLVGGIVLPSYSLIQSFNKISDFRFLSTQEKALKTAKEQLLSQIGNIKINLRSESRSYLNLRDVLLKKTGDTSLLEIGSQSAPIQALFDTIVAVDSELGVFSVRKKASYAFAALGIPLGIAQLSLSFLGTKSLMESLAQDTWKCYAAAFVCTSVVTYLYGFDTPLSLKALSERAYDVLTEMQLKTIGAKISPGLNAAITALGVGLASFSWGSLYTLAKSYYHDVKIRDFSVMIPMEWILSAGFVVLILNAFADITDDIMRIIYTNSNKNELIEVYLKLEKLEELMAGCSQIDFAKFTKAYPEDAIGAFSAQIQSIRSVADEYIEQQTDEKLALVN